MYIAAKAEQRRAEVNKSMVSSSSAFEGSAYEDGSQSVCKSETSLVVTEECNLPQSGKSHRDTFRDREIPKCFSATQYTSPSCSKAISYADELKLKIEKLKQFKRESAKWSRLQKQQIRLMKIVYVKGIPQNATEESLLIFFSEVVEKMGGTTGPGDCVVSAYINHENKSAILELRNHQEATNTLVLHGIAFLMKHLQVTRPRDYYTSLPPQFQLVRPNPNLKLKRIGHGMSAASVRINLKENP